MQQSVAPRTQELWHRNQEFIAGGVFSLNRSINPMRIFERAKGAYIWDIEGKRYIDYHAAFAPYFLGHSDPDVDEAVIKAVRHSSSLYGAGTTPGEGELAELLVSCVPTMEQVQVTNTGSEATSFAIRLARAVTGRDGIIVMQGGYNGWQDDVAFNLMDPLEKQRQRGSGEGLELNPITAGIPESVKRNVYAVQFNELESVENLLVGGGIAAIILEPVLQNIGVVKPNSGYLEGLRGLCTRYGALLIFDEVKTGFRHALGGYQSLCGVTPDLSTFGKAVANGYPLGVIGGKREYMSYVNHPDPQRRVLIAGTYNGHPVPVAAAITTLKKLRANEDEIYGHTERLGRMMEEGLNEIFVPTGYPFTVARQGSAFVIYFMERPPVNWLEIAREHDMERDRQYRRRLIEEGVFHFPVPTKQGSISFAHSEDDIVETLETTERVVRAGL